MFHPERKNQSQKIIDKLTKKFLDKNINGINIFSCWKKF